MAKKEKEFNADIEAVVKMQESIETADELYLDGKSYDLDRIGDEVSFYQKQAGESLIEIGKRLILVKHHEDHGKFQAFIEKYGMAYRSAAYAMTAARKFANVQSIAHLGTTKMIALSVLDDDDVETLEKGGSIKGMTVDDIDRMTVRELKENLRKEEEKVKKEKEARKKDREAFEKSLTAKDQKLNDYELREAGMEPPSALKIAIGKAEELKREAFTKMLVAAQYISEAEALAEKIRTVPGITAEALTVVKEQLTVPYDALCNSYIELEDVLNDFFPPKTDRDLQQEQDNAAS
ncbi:MAG: hypothetical protein FWD91_00900 [Treponema sp.]|nr:hypothetical protein [Treponema sp.]